MDDPLDTLPRLGVEAAAPCACCRRSIGETGLPIFYRLTVQHCGIDGRAVRQRAGLGELLGGGPAALAIADAIGAHRQPIVVMSSGTITVCHACAADQLGFLHLALEHEAPAESAAS